MTLITSPLAYHKLHSQHHGPMCEFVCLPLFLFDEFCRKSGKPMEDSYAFVADWSFKVRATWQGRDITDDNLVFWRKRWAERGQVKPSLGSDRDAAAVAQALDTRRRRAEMAEQGLSGVEIEKLLDAEYSRRLAGGTP